MTLDELLLEWSYRSEKGYPSLDSPSDISVLKGILRELKLPEKDINNLVDSLEEEDKDTTTNKKEDSPEVTSNITIKDIINLLPNIENDQEALIKMQQYILNRKGEIEFFSGLTTKNITTSTIDSSNAPKDLYQILSDNDDVENYYQYSQPNFSELGKSGNIFNFYEKNSKLKRQTILNLFDFYGTEGGRGVGKGEMAFALLFNDIKMSSGAGDLDWNGEYLEVKGSNARLGGRDRAFGSYEKSSLGQLAIKYDKSDKNLISLISNLSNETDINLNDLLKAVIDFENEAHPKGDAKKYFTLDIIGEPDKIRKAFCKNYIINYANTHGVKYFIWWNSEVYGKKSDTPGGAKTKWGTYVIFTPEEADGLVDNNTLITGMPAVDNLDPTTSRP
jgi:hypothetical protein